MTPHLHDLDLERYLHEPPGGDVGQRVEAHLAGCALCQGRVAAMRRMNASPIAPPADAAPPPASPAEPAPDNLAEVVPFPRRPAVRVALALAAALAIFVAVPKGTHSHDGLRTKGSSFDVGFWLHDGARQRLVADGDEVRSGDRLGFRVASSAAGWLLIVGIDERGPAYPCYPQGTSVRAVQLAPSDQAAALDAAVRFDDQAGTERIVALRCDAPFALADVAEALASAARKTPTGQRLPLLRPGCVQRQIALRKRPTAPGGGAPSSKEAPVAP